MVVAQKKSTPCRVKQQLAKATKKTENVLPTPAVTAYYVVYTYKHSLAALKPSLFIPIVVVVVLSDGYERT